MVKIYVTRYALTAGIKVIEANESSTSEGIFVRRDKNDWPTYYYTGDYELTLEAAQQKAEAMRQRKLTSLRKQIDKLEKMKF